MLGLRSRSCGGEAHENSWRKGYMVLSEWGGGFRDLIDTNEEPGAKQGCQIFLFTGFDQVRLNI